MPECVADITTYRERRNGRMISMTFMKGRPPPRSARSAVAAERSAACPDRRPAPAQIRFLAGHGVEPPSLRRDVTRRDATRRCGHRSSRALDRRQSERIRLCLCRRQRRRLCRRRRRRRRRRRGATTVAGSTTGARWNHKQVVKRDDDITRP